MNSSLSPKSKRKYLKTMVDRSTRNWLFLGAVLFIALIFFFMSSDSINTGKHPLNPQILHAAYSGTQDEYISAKIASGYENTLFDILGGKGWPGLTFGNLKNCYGNNELLGADGTQNRKRLANMYLKGSGLEVGVSHSKFSVPATTKVKYVNALSLSEQRKVFPKHSHAHIHGNNSEPDIVDKIHLLTQIETKSQDFLIANHVLEHTQHVFLSLYNYIRVVKNGGILLLIFPVRCHTANRHRVVTSYKHLLQEYDRADNVVKNRPEHYREFALTQYKDATPSAKDSIKLEDQVQLLQKQDKHVVQYHTYDQESVIELLHRLRNELEFPFFVREFVLQNNEIVAVLQKM